MLPKALTRPVVRASLSSEWPIKGPLEILGTVVFKGMVC